MPESQYEFTFSIHDAIRPAILLDKNGRVLEANEPFYQEFGYDQKIHGRPYESICHPEEDTAFLQRMITPQLRERRLKKENGDWHWVEESTVKKICPKTQNPYVIASYSDITKSFNRLTRLLNNTPSMVGYWTKDKINLFANDAYVQFFGKTPNEIRGHHIRDVLGPDLYLKNLPYMEGALRGQLQTFERAIPSPNGDIKYSIASYIPDIENGQVRGFFVQVTDISDVKKAEKTLLEAKNLAEKEKRNFDTFFHAFNYSTIVARTDASGIISYVNNKFCEISGYSRQELLGRNHSILKSGIHSIDFYRNLWKTIKSGEAWNGEICNRRKDGSLYWVQSTIFPMMDAQGCVNEFISVRFDITEKKESEQKLLMTSKLESLGESASSIAHEVNAPLSIVSLKLQRILTETKKNDLDKTRLIQDLEKMQKLAERISKIVHGLKSFSRMDEDSESFTETSFAFILEDTLAICENRMKDSEIQFEGPMYDINIECCPTQISQVLLNLFNNSIDAISRNSIKWMKVDLSKSENYLFITVSDSGAKINEKISEKMMNPFFTTKPIGKGTGLGLSISKKIALAHGGDLFFEDKDSINKFILKLPLRRN